MLYIIYNYKGGKLKWKNKKEKNGLIIIIAILALVAVIAGAIFIVYQSPKQIYKRLIGETANTLARVGEQSNFETIKSDLNLTAEVNFEELDSSISELINNLDLSLNMQIDAKNQKVLANIEADYDNKDLLNAQIYSNVKEQKTYAYFKDFYNKYIEVDMEENSYDTMEEMFEEHDKLADSVENQKNIISILEKELKNSVKSEYCSQEKVKLNINGQELNTTKNTFEISKEQLKKEFTTIMKNLENNETFLACFEDSDEIKENLEDYINVLENSDEDTEENNTMIINLYMTGLIKQQIVKAEMKIKEDDEISSEISVMKNDEKNYDCVVYTDEENVLEFNLKIENDNTYIISTEVEELGSIKLKIKYNQKLNEKIDKVNTFGSVKVDELTQEDLTTIYTAIENSELYKIISSFMGGNINLLPSNGQNSNINNSDSNI